MTIAAQPDGSERTLGCCRCCCCCCCCSRGSPSPLDVAIALSPLLPPVPPPLDFWPFRAPFVPFRRFLPSSLDPLWSAPVLLVVAPVFFLATVSHSPSPSSSIVSIGFSPTPWSFAALPVPVVDDTIPSASSPLVAAHAATSRVSCARMFQKLRRAPRAREGV